MYGYLMSWGISFWPQIQLFPIHTLHTEICMWFAELSIFSVVFITIKQSCKGRATGADAVTDNKYREYVVNHTCWVEPRCR